MQFSLIHRSKAIFAAMTLALVFTHGAGAVGPLPPTGGPPAPVLVDISVSGPVSMDENSSEQMLCTASYSDGTSVQVSPVWSEDSSEAAIDGSGMLSVGDVTGDQVVNVYADFGGKSKSLSITIVDTTPVLDSLEISGPTVVAEGTSEQFSCTAIYSDGSVLAITPAWSVSPGIASIDSAGLLIAGDVVSDQEVTVSASFGGKTVLLKVLIKYVPPVLSGLTIQGAVSMNEETSVQLNCVGHYSDGSTALVVAEWSENSSYATIDGSGVLSAGNVSSDQNVMVGASFGGYADTHSVVIKYVAPTLIGITVSGPSIVAENSSGQYGCVATYSDGTTQAVVPDWSENSSHASINSSGTLTAGDVSSDQSLTVSATYQGKSDSMPVTIKYEHRRCSRFRFQDRPVWMKANRLNTPASQAIPMGHRKVLWPLGSWIRSLPKSALRECSWLAPWPRMRR